MIATGEKTKGNGESAEDLARYRRGVETLFKLNSDKAISNGIPAHAAILFELFIKNSTEQVRIFCRNLNAKVFDNPVLINQAAWALQNGKKILVVVQEQPEPSGFLDLVKNDVVMADDGGQRMSLNFAIMDKKAVRCERDREKCEAVASMNAPDVADTLALCFDGMWERGSRLFPVA